MLYNKIGLGNIFLGWIDFFKNYDKEEFDRIKKFVDKIKLDLDVFLVIGIGGFYLGLRVVIDMVSYFFRNGFKKE